MRYFTKKLVGFYYRVVFPEKAAVMTDGIRHGLLIPPCLFPSPLGGCPPMHRLPWLFPHYWSDEGVQLTYPSWAQGIKQLRCVAHLKQWRVHRWDCWDTSHPWGHRKKSSFLLVFALIMKKQAQESQQFCWLNIHSGLICNRSKVIIEYLILQWT